MKASHDSLTSYPLKNWLLYPISTFAKTQDKTIEQQLDSGVRYLDLRFTNFSNNLYASHGVCVYDITIDEVFERINTWCEANKTDVYFRVMYEHTLSDIGFLSFKHRVEMCLAYLSDYLKLHFIGRKKEWNKHVYFMNIPFEGKNDYLIKEIDSKLSEMKYYESKVIPFKADPFVYQCYSYKILHPRFGSWLLNGHIPDNSMRNFI